MAVDREQDHRLNITVEAVGCSNACLHCSVGGCGPRSGFYSLDELRQISLEWGPIWPLFEATAHPEFPGILEPDIVGEGGAAFPPTNGSGIVARDDWRDILDRLRDLGCKGLSFTLHGLESNHDSFARSRGAFSTIIEASRRVMASGLALRWQIFVDRRNTDDVRGVMDLGTREFGLDNFELLFADPVVSPRGRLYEDIRPRLKDVQALLNSLDPGRWSSWFKDRPLEQLTESALLDSWDAGVDAKRFYSPWEPRSWPPAPPFGNLMFRIDRNRRIFCDPGCGERILLGHLSDGKVAILERLQQMQAPPHSNITCTEARAVLQSCESDLLHGEVASVRQKAIIYSLFAVG